MDALIKAARDKVNWSLDNLESYSHTSPAQHRKQHIARAINAVDALKSALKTIQ